MNKNMSLPSLRAAQESLAKNYIWTILNELVIYPYKPRFVQELMVENAQKHDWFNLEVQSMLLADIYIGG